MNSDNNSFNLSVTKCSRIPDTELGRTALVIANAIILLVALVGNGLILLVFKKSKRMKNTTDVLIANLATSDLIFPILAIPKHVTSMYLGEESYAIDVGLLGQVLCKTTYFLQDVSTTVSIFTILLITMDRFIAVVLPLRGYTIQQRTCNILVALTWIISVCIFGVYLKVVRLYYSSPSSAYPVCFPVWPIDIAQSYFISLSVSMALFPLAVIIILYSIIFIKLRRQQRRIGTSLTDPQVVQRSLRQRKVLYLSFAIVISFVICWAPLNVSAFLNIFHFQDTSCSLDALLFFGKFLAHASAAVNPVITFIFSTKFRAASREIFRRWERKHYRVKTISTNIEMQWKGCKIVKNRETAGTFIELCSVNYHYILGLSSGASREIFSSWERKHYRVKTISTNIEMQWKGSKIVKNRETVFVGTFIERCSGNCHYISELSSSMGKKQ